MQDQPSDAGLDSAPPTAAQDLKDQAVVLTHVLAVQPAQLIVPELVREIGAGVSEFAEDDRMERVSRITKIPHLRSRNFPTPCDSLP